MAVVAVVGAQWGDEGKGKIVDMLADRAHLVARSQGGNNAGHTVINELGEFRLHLVPAGIFHPQTTCIIGNGVVVHPAVLLQEMELLTRAGVSVSRLFVSDRAHLIMPYHLALDELEEQARGERALGTTKKGIGPAYADKVARLGLRMGDFLNEEVFYQKLAFVLEHKNRILTCLYGAPPFSLDEIYYQYLSYGRALAGHIAETSVLVQEALAKGENILLEGAQGTMLDLDFGTYPYVTSSSPTVGGACLGLGLGPRRIDFALGVYKAYSTRVGGGPFVTELRDEIGERIRAIGHEYGTTTGRPRRCGWFDAVAARFSAQLNGLDAIAVTRLDILDGFASLRICTAYRCGPQEYRHFPASLDLLRQCQPVYEELPGWQSPTREARRYEELPAAARRYLERIEALVGSPIAIVSVGPAREQTIIRREIF